MGFRFFEDKKNHILSHHYHDEAKMICEANLEHDHIKVSSTEEYSPSTGKFFIFTQIKLVGCSENGKPVIVFEGIKGQSPEIYHPQGSERWEECWTNTLVPRAKQKLREQKQKAREKAKVNKQALKNDRNELWQKNYSPLP